MAYSYYSPNALTRSEIFINRSEIVFNAFFVDGPKSVDVTPASVFKRELYPTICSISRSFVAIS